MKLSQIRAETKTTLIHFQAGDLKVTYRPNAFTADVADALSQQVEDNPNQATDSFLEMASQIIESWDLEDDKGKIVPIEKARLRAEVPVAVFGRIFQAIQDDQTPGGEGKA